MVKPATVKGFWAAYRDARRPLEDWLAKTKAAGWRNLQDVRATFPYTDAVLLPSGNVVTVFNVKGNAYRLIVAIHYRRAHPQRGIVFIRDFMTHADYSKDDWKERH